MSKLFLILFCLGTVSSFPFGIESIWQKVQNGANSVVNKGKDTVERGAGTVVGGISSGVDGSKKIVEIVRNGAGNAVITGKDKVSPGFQGIKGVAEQAIKEVKAVPDTIKDGISSSVQKTTNVLKEIPNRIGNLLKNIKNAFAGLVNAPRNILQSTWDWLKKWFGHVLVVMVIVALLVGTLFLSCYAKNFCDACSKCFCCCEKLSGLKSKRKGKRNLVKYDKSSIHLLTKEV